MTPTLRELAEETAVYVPARPGGEVVDLGAVWYFAGSREAAVMRVRLASGDVAGSLEQVRRMTRERGFCRITWWVGSSATPGDLVERLLALGLEPDEEEPTLTAMAGTTPPRQVDGVDVRRVESERDYVRALEIQWNVQGVPDAERKRRRAGPRALAGDARARRRAALHRVAGRA